MRGTRADVPFGGVVAEVRAFMLAILAHIVQAMEAFIRVVVAVDMAIAQLLQLKATFRRGAIAFGLFADDRFI